MNENKIPVAVRHKLGCPYPCPPKMFDRLLSPAAGAIHFLYGIGSVCALFALVQNRSGL